MAKFAKKRSWTTGRTGICKIVCVFAENSSVDSGWRSAITDTNDVGPMPDP